VPDVIGTLTRRRLLASASATLAGLAGCLDDGSGTGDSDGEASGSGGAGAGEDGADTGTDGGNDDLDLREANVTAVAVEPADEGSYRFDVTLVHDDDGEDGYANWWQVETLAGDRLGRRALRHAHGNEPFTRSATIPVPADVECVVVRGHDRTHGYGGQAMLVTVEPATTSARRQGSDRSDFSDADCP
jgi:hypothetical protein